MLLILVLFLPTALTFTPLPPLTAMSHSPPTHRAYSHGAGPDPDPFEGAPWDELSGGPRVWLDEAQRLRDEVAIMEKELEISKQVQRVEFFNTLAAGAESLNRRQFRTALEIRDMLPVGSTKADTLFDQLAAQEHIRATNFLSKAEMKSRLRNIRENENENENEIDTETTTTQSGQPTTSSSVEVVFARVFGAVSYAFPIAVASGMVDPFATICMLAGLFGASWAEGLHPLGRVSARQSILLNLAQSILSIPGLLVLLFLGKSMASYYLGVLHIVIGALCFMAASQALVLGERAIIPLISDVADGMEG